MELTLEQSLRLRKLTDLLPNASREDIITVLLALQKQNFVLSNTMTNLVKKWPAPQTEPITDENADGFLAKFMVEVKRPND